jgi:transposase
MSLPPPPVQRSLFDVSNLLGRSFEPTDRFRLFADKIHPLLLAARKELEACYCQETGRPAEEPVLLLGATLLQFMERLPDRQATECVMYHLGWKLALMQDMSPKAFHATTLCNFRERLELHKKAKLAFDTVLNGLIEAGLVARRSNQRLDSTHVLGLVAKMSRLECVRETIRLALQELRCGIAAIYEAEQPALPASWPLLWERYVQSKLDYRADSVALTEKMTQAGTDAWELLRWVETLLSGEGPAAERRQALTRGEKVLLLARVFGENYDAPTATDPLRQKAAQTSAAVKNPHDPDAQYSHKRKRRTKGAKSDAGKSDNASADTKGKDGIEWIGFKVQVAETVEDEPREAGEPTVSFITSVETQSANGSDEAGMDQTLESQEKSGLAPPPQFYVDGAYVSAAAIVEAESQGRELVGPAQPATNKAAGFKTEAFDVDVENRKATCPAGHPSTNCSRLEEKATGKVSFRFEWSGSNGPCQGCRLRDQCVSPGQHHRTLAVGGSHAHLQQRRRDMQTVEFKERMKRRNAIEGTQSELVRGHGMRRARYRGLKKVRLQNYFIGAAANAKRWARRVAWDIRQSDKNTKSPLAGALRPEETVAANA